MSGQLSMCQKNQDFIICFAYLPGGPIGSYLPGLESCAGVIYTCSGLGFKLKVWAELTGVFCGAAQTFQAKAFESIPSIWHGVTIFHGCQVRRTSFGKTIDFLPGEILKQS